MMLKGIQKFELLVDEKELLEINGGMDKEGNYGRRPYDIAKQVKKNTIEKISKKRETIAKARKKEEDRKAYYKAFPQKDYRKIFN